MKNHGRVSTKWIAAAVLASLPVVVSGQRDWMHAGQDAGGSKFSQLQQINASNVGQLKRAWVEYPELEARGIMDVGTPNLGGSITTAGGLVFIAATVDSMFRAFDAQTGKELWSFKLEVPGHSIPTTYTGRDGKQYVAVVSGGGPYPGVVPYGDYISAFALP